MGAGTDMNISLRFDGVYSAPFVEDDFLGHADFYIRFFPDGSLRAAASFDYNNPSDDRQSPEHEFVRLGDEDQDRFTGSYTMTEAGFRYRIMDGCFVAEEGRGAFNGCPESITLFPTENEPLNYCFVPCRGTQ